MTTAQTSLFYDSYDDAIRDACLAIGGFKKVGAMLWPTIPADDAGRRLAHCLNGEKRDKLGPGELQLIRRAARQAGVHVLAAYECRDAGYADPLPLAPEDEAAQLKREYIAAVRQLSAIQARIDHNAMKVVA